jgi:hypothetical protein
MQGNRSHLAFGGGPHECPGQDIGRAIADVGVDALLMRVPDIQLDCEERELRWRASMSSRHLVELPVRFEPKPPQDVTQLPALHAMPRQRPSWQVTTENTESPAPTPQPVAPQPTPAPEPAHRLGAWQRFLRWWRGY